MDGWSNGCEQRI